MYFLCYFVKISSTFMILLNFVRVFAIAHDQRLSIWNEKFENLKKDAFDSYPTITELEISSNDIGSLSSDAFESLTIVESINLTSNRLTMLPYQLFSGNKLLKTVRISNNYLNSNTELPSQFFAHLILLDAVWIENCNFTSLPEDLFRESYNLRNISLAYNNFKEIPVQLFYDQTNLLSLDLSHNQLLALDDKLFEDSTTLTILHLSHNRLSNISRNLVSGMIDLQELYLDNNNLHTIHNGAFDGTNLRVLHLQNNWLSFENLAIESLLEKFPSEKNDTSRTDDDVETNMENTSPFQQLDELQVLNMRNNSMKMFLDDWYFKNVALKELDLSFNQIEMLNFDDILSTWSEAIKINVSNNRIRNVMSSNSNAFDRTQSSVTWILNHNPLKCDCASMHFAAFLRHQMQSNENVNTKFVVDDLKCAAPERFENWPLQNIPLAELTCRLDNSNTQFCPKRCSCYVRTIDRTAVFNCSNANLTEMPSLPNINSKGLRGLQFYELYIENNNIRTFALVNATGYKSVSRIFARNNSLEEISAEHLPSNLLSLDLSANKLKRIDSTVLKKLSHMDILQNVSFGENPWICDCIAYDLIKFIESHHTKIVDIETTSCNNKSIRLISSNDLCPIELNTILILIVLAFAAVAAVVFLLTTFYYKNQDGFVARHKETDSF